MKTKSFATFVVFLVIASMWGFTEADWLDDFNAGTSQVLSTVNENAAKINTIATSIDNIGKILRAVDPDSDESDE